MSDGCGYIKKGVSLLVKDRLQLLMVLTVGFCLWVPADSPAADLNVTSETIFRGFDRQAKNGNKLSAAPGYEYIQLDYGNLKTPGLSLHVNGWGRLNLGDNYNDNDTAGELSHAYLQYVSPSRDVQIRAGRQYIFEGIARDNLDGVYAKTDMVRTLVLSAYAGAPVALASLNGRKDDFIIGGNVSHSRPGFYDLGFSYRYLSDNGHRGEEALGTDLSLQLPGDIYLLGHSAYNLVSSGWKEHFYELRIPVLQFSVRPFVQQFNYADYFSNRNNSTNMFRFLQGSDNSLTISGAEAFWNPTGHTEYALRFKNVDYDKRFSSSQMYTMLAVWRWKVLSEVGAELGRMQGSNQENRYYLGRGYFYWNISPYFATAEVMYVNYDKAIYNKSDSLFTSIGGGAKIFNNALSLKLSFDYGYDPYFNEDYRWMFKLTYLLDKTFGVASKKI
jgi:hypothetical protein